MVLEGQDFDLVAGDNGNIDIHVQTENSVGVLIDVVLTGALITWVLKEEEDSASALVTKTSAAPTEIEILNQTTYPGHFVVYILPADTASMTTPHKYFHGAKVFDVTSHTHTTTKGYITLSPKVI